MTITFPRTDVRRPDLKRYAVAGVAILATAVAVIGVRAAVGHDPATSTPTSATDSVTTVDASSIADFGSQADWMAADAGSLGIVAAVPSIATNSFSEADWMAADAGSLGIVAAVPSIATNSFSEADWMAADAGSLGVVPEG